MSKLDKFMGTAVPIFICIVVAWMFAALLFSSWADVECMKKGADTARSSSLFNYVCWNYGEGPSP